MLANIKQNGYVLALLGTILFGTEGVFIRFISLETASIIYFQGIFATIIMSAYFLISKNTRFFRPKHLFRRLIGISIISIVTRLLLYQSMKLIPIAIAVFIVFLFPLQVVILSHFFLEEKITKKILVSLCLAFTGIMLMFLFQESSFTFTHYLGYFLALAASFTSAIFIMSIKKYLNQESSYTITFYMYFLSAIILQIWVLRKGNYFRNVLSTDLVLLVIFSIVVSLALIFLVQSLKFIKAQEYSILSYFEPLTAYLLGFFILQQYLKITSILGGALICIGGLLIFWHTH